MGRLIAAIFTILVVIALAQAAWQHERLPETVASHFDARGQPDGWMSRNLHTTLHAGLIVFIAVFLEGIARLNRRLPDEYLNIPHRDYWLAPERRAATHAWLVTLLRAIGCTVLLFLIGLFHQVYRANQGAGLLTTSTLIMSLSLLVVLTVLLVACLVRFLRRPASPSEHR